MGVGTVPRVAPGTRQPSARTQIQAHAWATPGDGGAVRIRTWAPGAGTSQKGSSLYNQDTSHTPWHLAPAPTKRASSGYPARQASHHRPPKTFLRGAGTLRTPNEEPRTGCNGAGQNDSLPKEITMNPTILTRTGMWPEVTA